MTSPSGRRRRGGRRGGREVDEILTPSPAAVVENSGEGDDEEEEEEPDDEDVEASLDVILKERLVVEDEPEDEEATDQEDKTEGNERVLPKQPDEFVCRSASWSNTRASWQTQRDALPGLCLKTAIPMAGSRKEPAPPGLRSVCRDSDRRRRDLSGDLPD